MNDARPIVSLSLIMTLMSCLSYHWYNASFSEILWLSTVSLCANYLFFLVLGCVPILARVTVSVLCVIAVFFTYFMLTLGVSPYMDALGALAQTDVYEASELMSWGIIFPLLISMSLISFVYKHYRVHVKHSVIGIVVGALLVFTLPQKYREDLVTDVIHVLPFKFIYEAWIATIKAPVLEKAVTDLPSQVPFYLSDPDDLLIVLVIGESARAGQFHLNGYDRHTSPCLEQCQGLVSLTNYQALATTTREAMPYIYKRSQDRVLIDELETGFVSVLKSLGFRTTYLSAQNDQFREILRFVDEFDTVKLGHNYRVSSNKPLYDEALLADAMPVIGASGKRLLVLHTLGSHYDYAKRVPDTFKDKRESDYDNTIIYTDYFLGKILKAVEKQRALFFYTSDHGESLIGDNPGSSQCPSGHGCPYDFAKNHVPRQLHIPGFWYMSPSYVKDRQSQMRALLAHAHQLLDQSMIFHSLLGCGGVSSEAIDPSKNICDPQQRA